MAQSIIGALRVVLGMNAGEFKKGAREAETRLDKLGRKFGISAKQAKIAGAAIGAAMVGAAAGVAVGVNRALTEFDKLTKMSRSVGVPVEQLTSLQHAAELSGASVDDLGKAFRNFARNAQSAARGPNDFSRSLDALNVSWRDADGHFRRADQVMLDVADRFAQMEDGAGKTALAMRIFGEERGPKLVSFLNAGSEGLRGMQAEAERLGITFDTKAGEAAERFNDQMDRISKANSAFSTQLTQKMLPALEFVVNKYAEWATNSSAVRTWTDLIAEAFAGVVSMATKAVTSVDVMWLKFKTMAHNTRDLLSFNTAAIEERNRIMQARISKLHGDLAHDLKLIWGEFNEGGWGPKLEPSGGEGDGLQKPPRVVALEQENAALALVNEAERERLQIMEAMRDPYEVMIDRQTRLNELFGESAVHARLLGKANQMAAAAMHNAYASAASAVSGALSNLFSESKGLAIANALINTYEAVTAALKNPPGPPFSYAYAAAALANGMAQVAAIRSTNKSGGGGGGSAAGGVGAGATQAAAPQQQQSFFIDLQGQTFGRDQVRGLIEQINDAVADGASIQLRAA